MASHESSNPEASSATSSRKRVKSEIWNHFDRLEIRNSDGILSDVRAVCNSCKKELSASSKCGTSHLHRHLARCLKPDQRDNRQATLPQFFSTCATSSLDCDSEATRKAIIKWIVLGNLHFVAVDDRHFETMIQTGFDPNFKMFSRETFKREVLKYYIEGKQSLISYIQSLKCKISLACDVWTSSHGFEYLCITAHFTDDTWVMQKRIIAFTRIEDKGQLGEIINNQLQTYGMENRIFTITFDHTLHDSAAILNLKCLLRLPCDGAFFHMRCMCYVIDKIVQSGTDEIKCVADKIRHIIYHIVGSEKGSRKFQMTCRRYNLKCERLPYDVEDRWNSTYRMIEAAVEYKPAINDYVHLENLDSGTLSCLTDLEWEVTEKMKDFLNPFHEAIIALCSSYNPTIVVAYTHILQIVHLFNDYRHKEGFSHILSRMEEKFYEYFSSLPVLLGIGILIDPRLKEDGLSKFCMFVYEKDEQKSNISTIKSYFEKLFHEYSLTVRNAQTQNLSFDSAAADDSRRNSLSYMVNKFWAESSSRGIAELQQYYNMPLFYYDGSDDFDILNWWKERRIQFPVLSTMARDILTISMCTIPSEYAFSTGGRKLDNCRSCLNGKTMEALICLQDWYAAENRDQDMQTIPPTLEFEILDI